MLTGQAYGLLGQAGVTAVVPEGDCGPAGAAQRGRHPPVQVSEERRVPYGFGRHAAVLPHPAAPARLDACHAGTEMPTPPRVSPP
ncbi:hypothetical protein GCM10029963_25640 [Micromonospora andamanensis]|nr:hypothetical protein Vwe01_52220 [Micromonospora andamanensis]